MEEVEKLERILAALKPMERDPAFLDLATCGDDIFYRLADLGKGLCSDMIPGESSFHFIDSSKKQAGVIYELSTVVVFQGMLNFIFRIASLAAGVERCPTQPPSNAVRPWAQNVAHWVEEGYFFFDDERYWWLQSPDHRSVFDFYVENIFRFVVLHEIGHFHNMHGARRQERSNGESSSSSEGANDTHEDLSVHVREIVADTYAFQFFLQGMIESLTEDEDHADNSEDLESTVELESTILALNIVQLYFWLSDSIPSTRTGFVLDLEKYPPHAFRMQAIESTLMEHGTHIVNAALVKKSLAQSMRQTLTISSNVAGTEDFITWRSKLLDPVFFEQYAKICRSVPEWANGVFGVYDLSPPDKC
jgi:hypothetical protein